MLELSRIRDHKEELIKAYTKRQLDVGAQLDEILKLDEERKRIQTEMDIKLGESKNIAKEIGSLFQSGEKAAAEALKTKPIQLKEEVQQLKERVNQIQEDLIIALCAIPNVPHVLVPAGKDEQDNETIFEWGDLPDLPEDSLPHWELADKYEIIDFEMGVKITGAGFPVYKGKGAILQRALINFFLDEARKAGYKEYMPPLMVNEASGFGTGQLPDKEGQMYHVQADNLYLIPTAEVPLTNLFRDEIIQLSDFPIKLCGYTPCFRREAGSYGKHVRGLNRLHQFDKVEIVEIEHPDKSYYNLDRMVEHVKSLLQKLELPFRVLRLCGGDLGFAAAITYDLEVYSGAQKRWLECSSVSNFETYQSNRLKLRFKTVDKGNQFAHTLNGSALALPRIVAAMLENNQSPTGIKIPEVLVPYTGFDIIV